MAHAPPVPRRRGSALLAALAFALLLVGWGVVALLQRAPVAERVPATRGAPLADAPRATLTVPAVLAPGAREPDLAHGNGARERTAPPADAPASILGRLRLDGQPPLDGARVLFRSEDGRSEGGVPIDPEGRFRIESPVPGTLALSFALPSPGARTLLFPRPRVELRAGQAAELDLDWRSRHVNLRVTGDAAGWNRATVQLVGPEHDARFETGDDGKAELALVGAGTFRFAAQHPSGRRGEGVLELAGEAELASLVIRLDGR